MEPPYPKTHLPVANGPTAITAIATSKALKWIALGAILLVIVFVGWRAWQKRHRSALPEGIAMGNGRLEAIQVDVATQVAGRVANVLVNEGDHVEAGQVLARMDTARLRAQLHEAEAHTANAASGKVTALASIAARENAESTVEALVTQRQSDVGLAQAQLDRSTALLAQGAISQQQFDIERSKHTSMTALLTAAKSQVNEAHTAITVAKAQAVSSETATQVALATTARVMADLAESELKAPRGGRVQHRLVQPGEVVGAGGKILVIVDLLDVYMTVFLPETVVGRLAVGSEARLVLDAAPAYVFPARVSYVASEAQFTPKTVETTNERQKLVFEVKLQLDEHLLATYAALVKVGIPGFAYVRINAATPWPEMLRVKLPTAPPGPR